MKENKKETSEKIGNSAKIVGKTLGESAAEVIGTFASAITEGIVPDTIEAVDEIKEAFSEDGAEKDYKAYLKTVGAAAKATAKGAVDVISACASAAVDTVIPNVVEGVEGIKSEFSDDEEHKTES